jgi:protein ImuA
MLHHEFALEVFMAVFTLIRALSASFLPSSVATAPSFRRSKSPVFSLHNKTAASGYRALDRELPNGGWPAAVLNELLLSEPDIGELNLLQHALPQMMADGKTLVLLASAERNLRAKLHEWNIDLNQVVLIEDEHPASHIATVERIMRDENFGALLCWLPEARDDHLQRLHAAIGNSKGWAFIFRPLEEQHRPSPAMLRMICRAAASTCIATQIIKRRGIVQGRSIILPLNLSMTDSDASMRTPAYAAQRMMTRHADSMQYQVDRRALAAAAASYRAGLH